MICGTEYVGTQHTKKTMSRIGKLELQIPDKTEVTLEGALVRVKGPLGELTKSVHADVMIKVDNGIVTVTPQKDTQLARALWGTFASHVRNMMQGVNEAYTKQLEIEGVGYRASMQGTALELLVGFSHPVRMEVPTGLEVTVEKNLITVKGINKELVGQFAANVRATKKPEPYKGKGIHYVGEYIVRKQGKKAA